MLDRPRSHAPLRRFASCSRALALALVAAALTPTPARAQTRGSGIQLTPDSARYLISKDVGLNRWAISYNLADKTITGNVFPTDGSAPQFVWCERVSQTTSPDPATIQVTLDCFGAPPCEASPCLATSWTPIGQVEVPGSFLLPVATGSTLSGNVQPIFTASCAISSACHAADGREPVLTEGRAHAATVGVPAIQDSTRDFVDPFSPDGSYLLDKILGVASSGSEMPPDGRPLGSAEVEAIRTWILEGAANN
jgi:hypothetical protein